MTGFSLLPPLPNGLEDPGEPHKRLSPGLMSQCLHIQLSMYSRGFRKDPSTIYEMGEAIFKRVCCPRLKSWPYCRVMLTIKAPKNTLAMQGVLFLLPNHIYGYTLMGDSHTIIHCERSPIRSFSIRFFAASLLAYKPSRLTAFGSMNPAFPPAGLLSEPGGSVYSFQYRNNYIKIDMTSNQGLQKSYISGFDPSHFPQKHNDKIILTFIMVVIILKHDCGCSSMVEHQPSKLNTWVRFPSPAPKQDLRGRSFFFCLFFWDNTL